MLWKENSFGYSELGEFCCIGADMFWIAQTSNVLILHA